MEDRLRKLKQFLMRKLVKETVWSILTKGSTFVIFILINLLLARTLGPHSYGMWSVYFSTLNIITVVSYLGINSAARTYVARHNNTPDLKAVLRQSFRLRIVVSLVFALSIFILADPIADLLKRGEIKPLLEASAPIIFLTGILEYLKSLFIAVHRLKYSLISNLIEYVGKLVLSYLFLRLVNHPIAILWAFTLANALAVLWSLIFSGRKLFNGLSDTTVSFLKEMSKYAVPLFIIDLGFILTAELDTVMLGLFRGNYEVGIYNAAKQFVVKLPQISLAISMGTMPIFAKLGADNKEKLKAVFSRLMKINAVIFGVIVLGILLFSGLVVKYALGSEYSQSALPMKLLIPYLLAYSFSIFFSNVLDYTGKAGVRARNFMISVFINIAVNLYLIPRYGAAGAALGTSIAYIPYTIQNWWEVRKILYR